SVGLGELVVDGEADGSLERLQREPSRRLEADDLELVLDVAAHHAAALEDAHALGNWLVGARSHGARLPLWQPREVDEQLEDLARRSRDLDRKVDSDHGREATRPASLDAAPIEY